MGGARFGGVGMGGARFGGVGMGRIGMGPGTFGGRAAVFPGNRFVGNRFVGNRFVGNRFAFNRFAFNNRFHHRFFRNRFAFFVGAGLPFYSYYDDCYARVWTAWGWQWQNVCY